MGKDRKTLKTTKGQVSPQALLQRINRAMAKEDQVLKTTRGERWRGELGDHYIVDINLNAVIAQHCDLEALSTELGVLKNWETLASRWPSTEGHMCH